MMQVPDATRSPLPHTLVVLATGGTIAGLSAHPGQAVGYDAAQLGVAQLLTGVPTPPGFTVVQEQVAQLDSKDMDFSVWRRLALRCAEWLARPEVAGIVVTHGTDTLEETAVLLQSVLMPAKPVVLACAMRPADALSPDGPVNLRDALVVAACAEARGVVAVCAGAVHAALDVRKVHPYRLDAFSSGDAGPLGYVEEAQLRRLRAWPQGDRPALAAQQLPADDSQWPWVEMVSSHAGADGIVVDLLVRAGVRGLVVVATGNGSLHYRMEAALLRARSAGVQVLRASRCAEGALIGVSGDVLPHGGALTPAKARVALLLDLVQRNAAETIRSSAPAARAP